MNASNILPNSPQQSNPIQDEIDHIKNVGIPTWDKLITEYEERTKNTTNLDEQRFNRFVIIPVLEQLKRDHETRLRQLEARS